MVCTYTDVSFALQERPLFQWLRCSKKPKKALSTYLGLWQYQRLCSRSDVKRSPLCEMIRSQQPVQVVICVALKMASLSNNTTILYTKFHYIPRFTIKLGSERSFTACQKRPFVERYELRSIWCLFLESSHWPYRSKKPLCPHSPPMHFENAAVTHQCLQWRTALQHLSLSPRTALGRI